MQQSPHIKAVIGLGNPGPRFEGTRHNIGFAILDALAEKYHSSWLDKQNMLITSLSSNAGDVWLVKPQTFMNNSSDVIPALLKKGIKPEELLVIHDELELAFGKIKIRNGGSARGHNGLRSIIERIGADFPRLSIGIGRPTTQSVSDYVLSQFDEKEQVDLPKIYDNAIQQIEALLNK